MARIDRDGVPPMRAGRTYEVRHAGCSYPPKLLVSLACELAFGRALPPAVFAGGAEVNGFLRRLGFTVAIRGSTDIERSGADQPHRGVDAEIEPPARLDLGGLAALKHRLLSLARLFTWTELEDDQNRPPAAPGVYAWFFKTVPPGVSTASCFTRDGLVLLYVGMSPGTPHSNETLRSRLRFHYRGNAEGSTLRLTLGCLLKDRLGTVLRCSGRRMMFGTAERQLSEWMAAHTAVTWTEFTTPGVLEKHLLETLDLPLNLNGNRRHLFCERLVELRHAARVRARELPNLKSA